MSFKENKYEIIRNAITEDLANFCYAYLLQKREVVKYLHNKEIINVRNGESLWGVWDDTSVPNTYVNYGDILTETLLVKLKTKMMEITGKKLVPCYSFLRIYKNGDILKRHKDRPSCEISCTLNLGGDEWPINLDPSEGTDKKGIKVFLNPGDMLVYSGCDLEHWRDPFQGQDCCQTFLHYNDINGPFKDLNKYDGRAMLGLPWFLSNNNTKT
tara:strand:- start:333 stop:971 length:639 start_codon:yes stop_codon:yes gene_type:complete